MFLLRACLFALASLALPLAAAAKCGGEDLMAELAQSDPAEHAGILERGAALLNGQGKLWEVSKPGIEPSIILGTFHDTEMAEEPLPAAAVHALDQSRALMVEITPEEQDKLRQRIASDPTFAFEPDGSGWVELLSPEQRAMADAALRERGLDLAAASHMKPWMLMSVLGIPQCQLAQMASGKPVLDAMIVERALGLGIPVKGLEGYLDAISAFELINLEQLSDLTIDMLAHVGDEEDARATMLNLYRDGQIGAILEFGIWQSKQLTGEANARQIAEAFRDAIITHRNIEWMDVLEAELQQGNVFVAFGALHLIDEEGVLALLQERGWHILRLDG